MHVESELHLLLFASILLVAVINIFMMFMFTLKLRSVLIDANVNECGNKEVNSLIVKVYILSLFGSISTIVLWILWMFTDGDAVLLYLDLFVNCLVIGLMFKYNRKIYAPLCKCCIFVCHRVQRTRLQELKMVESISNSTSMPSRAASSISAKAPESASARDESSGEKEDEQYPNECVVEIASGEPQ